tara:strand:- start:239 stop:667 length:429 start_codon:yes stop_codon:yes gene_type:complete
MGMALLLIIGIGWGKPVPVNNYNLRKSPKYGPAITAVSGACANLILAIFLGIIVRLDFLPVGSFVMSFLVLTIQINIILAVFNLIPIPPLDGSHILFTFLPQKYENIKRFLMQYHWFLLIGLIFFGRKLIFFIVDRVFNFII